MEIRHMTPRERTSVTLRLENTIVEAIVTLSGHLTDLNTKCKCTHDILKESLHDFAYTYILSTDVHMLATAFSELVYAAAQSHAGAHFREKRSL